MKALEYLAKHGVEPKGNREALIATILWFSPYHHKDLAIYPDATWIGNPERCNRIVHWLDGTVEEIYAELKAAPIGTLVEMLTDVLDIICWDYGIENKVANLPQAMRSSRQWACLWNGFLGIAPEGEGAWANKREVIEAYANENRWEEEVQPIIQICEEAVAC